jgi:aminoglycoside phosphotransferase (APT) family kinase protein
VPPPLFAPTIVKQSDGLLLLGAIAWHPRLRPWVLPKDVARALGAFFQTRSGSGKTGVGLSHGDCAPWNLLRTDRGWGLVDWEEAHDQGMPFFDLFHYLILAHLNLERPSQKALLEGLRGQGWVARSIEAYAEGAKLRVEDARRFLISYLEFPGRRLDVSTPAGRGLVEGHRRLLQAVGK